MWTCSICETKNKDTDAFCECCGNKRPASAAPKTSGQSTGNNQPGAAKQPAATQQPPRTSGAAQRRPAAEKKQPPSYEEKRLMELRAAVKIPAEPRTRQDNSLGYWLRHIIGCFLLGTVAAVFLSDIPVWIFGDLVEKMGGTPLLTYDSVEGLSRVMIIVCYILYWVIIIQRRKHADEFQVRWTGSEIICRWHPLKDTHNIGVGLDGEWIAYDTFVMNGSWQKQDGKAVGLRCAYDHQPKKAVLAEISTEGATMKYTGASYISEADVQ